MFAGLPSFSPDGFSGTIPLETTSSVSTFVVSWNDDALMNDSVRSEVPSLRNASGRVRCGGIPQ